MEGQQPAKQEEAPELPSEQLFFEGSAQDTVEILPRLDRLSPREREQSVVAGVGRARMNRQVGEGRPAARTATLHFDPRADELLAVTYQIATFFTIVIVGVILATAVAVVLTSSVAR
ncbi:MAG TPA: hypothetical protein VN837_11720 [Chloroflexota bacterium]|nr:hypothetical protein [Chloroflexota bacterium]